MTIDERLEEVIDCLYRIAVKAVICKDGKVLLVQDSTDDGWCLPGGGVDVGETLESALIRELIEEIGVLKSDIQSDFKIQSISIGHIREQIPRCNIHFKVNLLTYNVKPTQETEELEWIPISELENQKFDLTAGPKDELIQLINRLA